MNKAYTGYEIFPCILMGPCRIQHRYGYINPGITYNLLNNWKWAKSISTSMSSHAFQIEKKSADLGTELNISNLDHVLGSNVCFSTGFCEAHGPHEACVKCSTKGLWGTWEKASAEDAIIINDSKCFFIVFKFFSKIRPLEWKLKLKRKKL